MRKKSIFFKLIFIVLVIFIITCIINFGKNVTEDIVKVVEVEEQYTHVELSKAFNSILAGKLVEASHETQPANLDLSAAYSENKLIDEFLIPEGYIKPIKKEGKENKVSSTNYAGEVNTSYLINVKKLVTKENFYGKGESLETGDVYTLEPILEKDENGVEKTTGRYQIKYYDSNKKAIVIEEVKLYADNKT